MAQRFCLSQHKSNHWRVWEKCLFFFASNCVSSRSWPFKMGWICTLSDIFGSLVLLTFALILVKWIPALSSAHQFFTDSFREITILRYKRTLCDSARKFFLTQWFAPLSVVIFQVNFKTWASQQRWKLVSFRLSPTSVELAQIKNRRYTEWTSVAPA